MTTLLMIVLFCSSALATPMGPIEFPAYVVSVESRTAKIRMQNKEYKIPRAALDKKTKARTVATVSMSYEDYQKMTRP